MEKGRIFVSQSISFHPELLARAKQRAKRLGLPFSTYVQKCLEKDIVSRDPIVFSERSGGDALVAEEPAPARPRRGKPDSRRTT